MLAMAKLARKADPIQKREAINDRVVILLRKSERRYVEKLAASENVSTGEIFRRSLETYQTIENRLRKQQEEEMLRSAITMLDSALSGVNESIAETCRKLDRLHLELKKRELA
jgi:RNA polymerase-interacting CarD/CdnL/TRCF family regulator